MSRIGLSFVIIEYLCLDDVFACIESIRKAVSNIPIEMIVSSNSSYQPIICKFLKKKMPFVKWLFNKTNKGFASAMNEGLSRCSGRAIVLMNPDVRIESYNVQKAYDFLLSEPSVGMIGPQIIDQENHIQDSCRKFLTLGRLLKRTTKRFLLKKNTLVELNFDYNSVQCIDWTIGAFMMLKRDALERVGLLDEHYFLYVEDMDWCKRFWDCGYQVVYYPELKIVYKGDRKSTTWIVNRNIFNRYTAYHLRSYARFLLKNKLKVSRRKQINGTRTFQDYSSKEQRVEHNTCSV